MTEHSELVIKYRRMCEVGLNLNNRLVRTIPRDSRGMRSHAGISPHGTLVFDSEADLSVLMDYCLYYSGPDGGNLVTTYLDKSPPPEDSAEMVALQAMTHSYYSMFQVTDVERAVGVNVQDLLRAEPGFIVDINFGNSAQRHLMLATRIIPMEGFLMSGGAALPVLPTAARHIFNELSRTKMRPETFDFKQITPRQEAELAALIIRSCRSTGMSTRIAYEDAGRSDGHGAGVSEGRSRRNGRCPCGSGKKYRACCGRR